ncbi:hypothetical protein A1O1_04445 [Capronia coronata CBS 617.96]|uniref:Adenosinetriphosphatase n=1 Tax=Capronia coronata CBS 617.96 TaxID=1182541 RepID=W9YFP5_9EURO|nr:uncharacterized protein A1O1_04445 [Capronia coronata CBS 617.96]EXJ91333.1 hypothetical protein A1O1_04445 [Capronia coronata CBS 617.96]
MEMSTQSDNDPRNWSIDRVVYELCQNPTPRWSTAEGPQFIPDRHLLEDTLRQNHVDGDNLLVLDMGALKDDLGVASFGQRRAIMKAVEHFRSWSPSWQDLKFNQDRIAKMQQELAAFRAQQEAPLQQFIQSQSRTSAAPLSTFAGPGTFPSVQSEPLTPSSLSHSSAVQPRLGPQKGVLMEIPDSVFPAPAPVTTQSSLQRTVPMPLDHPMVDMGATRSARPKEPATAKVFQPTGAPQRGAQQHALVKAKKRIVPTFVPQTDKVAAVEAAGITYLSPATVPVQDIFFHKILTDFGDIFYRTPVESSDNFVISSHAPNGRRRDVAKRIRHFLRQDVIKLPQSKNLIRLPYSSSRLQESVSEQYFTMFPQPGGQTRVYRVDDFPEVKKIAGEKNILPGTMALLTEHGSNVNGSPLKDGSDKKSDWHDLDYLLDKYPVAGSDEALPVYGDSGDEGELDEATWQEIQDERNEKARELSTMTRAQVEAVIDQTVEEMKQDWRNTKMVKAQLKAYRLWMQAAKKKNRRDELDYIDREKARFERMKNKIRQAVADDIWRTPAEVKKQCQNIEVAVFQYEEFEYYNQVLHQDYPPPRPSPKALKKACKHKQQALDDGEEIIDSESERLEDDAAFVVQESSDGGSIRHEPDPDWNPVIPDTKKDTDSRASTSHTSSTPIHGAAEDAESAMLIDSRASDADVDSETSDDEIVTPMRRRKRYDDNSSSSDNVEIAPTATNGLLSLPSRPRSSDAGSDNSDLDRLPRLPKSKFRTQGRRDTEPVDLTFSSPGPGNDSATNEVSTGTGTDFEVNTPELNPSTEQTPEKPRLRESSIISLSSTVDSMQLSPQDDSGLPHIEDIRGVRATDWAQIENLADRHRALAKAVYELDPEHVSGFCMFVDSLKTHSKRREVIFDGLLAFHRGQSRKIKGIEDKWQTMARVFVLFYVTFICGHQLMHMLSVSPVHIDRAFEEIGSSFDRFYGLLTRLLENLLHEFDYLDKQQGTKRKRDEESLSNAEILDNEMEIEDISSDPLGRDGPSSAHKKRKRKVVESQQALDMQQSDQARIQQQEQRRLEMAKRMTQMAASGDTRHPINTTEPYVYLHSHISNRVKPHQLMGIQFMWREIIEDPKHQGCILAHTMGLGKTMQVISLLVSISSCSKSSDPKVRGLIPAQLRKSKTLILCPASLVENWLDELMLWTPDPLFLGRIYKMESSNPSVLAEWSRHGGVLLASYERFRRMISLSAKSKEKGEHQVVDVEKILLEEPTLVVADEAHKLKNPGSTIHQYAKRFKTTSRIALTGSPLNNHLEEYYTMVDWIAPGYLGSIVQFRSKYSEPIIEGLYSDSTPFERRLCLRKLHVLKRDLDPKISRADISAIEKDMPTKTEFFITVPLTMLQQQAYDIYVKYMEETFRLTKGRARNARMWDWIAMLSWLCHHPSCFFTKLNERLEKDAAAGRHEANVALSASADEGNDATANQQADNAPTPETVKEDTQVDTSGVLGEAMQQVLQLFHESNYPGIFEEPSLSNRTLAVQQILKEASAIGDKTLVFTHSIPTLNYLERMLKDMGLRFFRLDGGTDVSTRQASTKKFNEKNQSDAQVFLISMKAGGLGLNLQGANRVIIFDFSFNPSWEEQAIGRAYRLNQKAPVFVYRFQAGGTFEDLLFNKAVFKTQLFGRVVDKKKPKRHATKSNVDYLFPVKDVPQQDFSDCLGKDPKVLDVVIRRLDCFRGIVLTETFQKEDDEQLNDEEQKAAEEEFRDQRLLREDPVAWEAKEAERRRKEHEQRRKEMEQRVPAQSQPTQALSAPQAPGSVPPVAVDTRSASSSAAEQHHRRVQASHAQQPWMTPSPHLSGPAGQVNTFSAPQASMMPPPFRRSDFDTTPYGQPMPPPPPPAPPLPPPPAGHFLARRQQNTPPTVPPAAPQGNQPFLQPNTTPAPTADAAKGDSDVVMNEG